MKLQTNLQNAKFKALGLISKSNLRKKPQFFPFFGGRRGPIKLTPFFAEVRNHPRKLLTKFQVQNSGSYEPKTRNRKKPTQKLKQVSQRKKTNKRDTSKIDSQGFEMDTGEICFEKFALFLSVDQNQQAPLLVQAVPKKKEK